MSSNEGSNNTSMSTINNNDTGCCSFQAQERVSNTSTNEGSVCKNVWIVLAFKFFSETSRAIWSNNILSSYLYLVTNENAEMIGLVSAVIGFSQLLSAIPAGYFADKYRRDVVSLIGAVFGAAALILTCIAVYRNHLVGVIVSLMLWGIFLGITSTSTMAMFVDCIPEISRSKFLTYQVETIRVAQMIGPSVSLLLFGVLGNKWTIRDCSLSIIIAQVVCVPAIIILCFLNDDNIGASRNEKELKRSLTKCYSSPISNESITSSTSSESANDEDFFVNANENTKKHQMEISSPCSQLKQYERMEIEIELGRQQSSPVSSIKSTVMISNEFQDGAGINGVGVKKLPDDMTNRCILIPLPWCKSQGKLHANFVPLVIAFTDITTAFAAGMSVRYFPIFFMKSLLLGPIHVQILYIIAPFGQIIFAHLAQKSGDRYGRAQTTVYLKLLGVALFFVMIFSYRFNASKNMAVRHRVAICVLYTFRTILMNCTQGLTKSILMEAVPKQQRAKWSTLDSLSTASWAASAYVGGVLVARCSIFVNFYVTAALQFFTTIPLIVLFKMT
jgi:MFS family permease